MLTPAFIGELHCPYCGLGLAVDRVLASRGDGIEQGVLRCACYRYPVIDGILVLTQQSGPADTQDARVTHLLTGEVEQARYRAMHVDAPLASVARSTWRRALERAAAHGVPLAQGLARLGASVPDRTAAAAEAPFAELLGVLRPGLYSQYLYHRYANNSFLASIAPLLLLGDLAPGQRVLELTCGIGHSAYLIQSLFPDLQLVATDHDYVNLSIARQHFAPHAQLVCLDAEAPLPFAAQSFGAVFCLDGFHYLRSKVALLQELGRVTDADALWLFPHLHNARAENFNPGIPLEPVQYGRCFSGVPHRMFGESQVLSDFCRDGSLRLDRTTAADDLSRSPNLTLIGTRRRDYWRARTDLSARLARRPETLIVNPIYRVEHHGSASRLQLSWPSPRLRAECIEVEDYLPSTCEVGTALLDRLRRNELTAEDQSAVRDLTRRFVLVNLPQAAYQPR